MKTKKTHTLSRILSMYLYTASIIAVLIVSSAWIIDEYLRHKQVVKEAGQTFMAEKRQELKNDINKVMEYINYKRTDAQTRDISEEQLKNEILDRLEHFETTFEGYVFAGKYDGHSLLGPAKGTNMYNATNSEGVFIVRELIKAAREGRGYVLYVMPKLLSRKPLPKLSYVVGIDEWQWYVGTGIYVHQIDTIVAHKNRELRQEILFRLLIIGLIIIIISGLSLLLVRIISSGIKKSLNVFIDHLKNAANYDKKIETNKITCTEYMTLANYINDMISHRYKAKRKIEQALHEKEILLAEIHHRVKNNLQIIISLIGLQLSKISDENTGTTLKDLSNRIMTMSLVHSHLYKHSSFTSIYFKDYITELVDKLLYAYDIHDKITYNVESDDIEIDLTIANPLGLIMNEIISNSIKYAFSNTETCHINIRLEIENEFIVLTLEDNGSGAPEAEMIETSEGLGHQLIHALVLQIEGTVKIDSTNGTRYTIRFKQDPQPEPL